MQQVEQGDRPSMGLLNLNEGDHKYQLTRHAPSEALRPFVKHYWIVSWIDCDLNRIPNMSCLTPVSIWLWNGTIRFSSDHRDMKFSYLVSGKGRVFGVKFKPGGFYPFLRVPVSSLYGQPMNVFNILDVTAESLEDRLLGAGDDADKPATSTNSIRVHTFLLKMLKREWLMILCNRLNRTERCCEWMICLLIGICIPESFNGCSISMWASDPKTVIKLYRLQNAAESMDRGLHCDLVKLSQDLGYHDQSHFIRDFKSIIGSTPEEYLHSKHPHGERRGLIN